MYTKEADEAKNIKSGEDIINLFLNTASRLESIIDFSNREHDNSTHTEVAALGSMIKRRDHKKYWKRVTIVINLITQENRIERIEKQ